LGISRIAMTFLSGRGLILVVEDEDDIRELALKVLRDEGYDLMQAASGGIALAILDQRLPIDLLFTDIVMPGEPDGVALAEWATKLRPGIKILYTTRFGSARRFGNRSLHGEVLAKPYLPKQLAIAVNQLLSAEAAAH
jgi:CheY-like chemotaxis protein